MKRSKDKRYAGGSHDAPGTVRKRERGVDPGQCVRHYKHGNCAQDSRSRPRKR